MFSFVNSIILTKRRPKQLVASLIAQFAVISMQQIFGGLGRVVFTAAQ